MDTIIKRYGRFELIRNEKGFCWRLTTRSGRAWYWHPHTCLWTFQCQPSPTEEAATAQLNWTLNHEDAGDLDRQHLTPTSDHHVSPLDDPPARHHA
jgi:hypothetical protein